MPSMTNGQRINQLVAPTMRMMPISSRRLSSAILIVLLIINSDTMTRMPMTMPDTQARMARMVANPSASS